MLAFTQLEPRGQKALKDDGQSTVHKHKRCADLLLQKTLHLGCLVVSQQLFLTTNVTNNVLYPCIDESLWVCSQAYDSARRAKSSPQGARWANGMCGSFWPNFNKHLEGQAQSIQQVTKEHEQIHLKRLSGCVGIQVIQGI